MSLRPHFTLTRGSTPTRASQSLTVSHSDLLARWRRWSSTTLKRLTRWFKGWLKKKARCATCGKREPLNYGAIIQDKFRQFCSTHCRAVYSPSERLSGVWSRRTQVERNHASADLLQPYKPNGQPNEAFIKIYGKREEVYGKER